MAEDAALTKLKAAIGGADFVALRIALEEAQEVSQGSYPI